MEEGGTGLSGETDATVRGGHAENVPHMQANAIICEAHEERHGAVVEVGTVVAVLFGDTKRAGRRGMRWSTGTHRKIHGQLPVHKVLPTLVGELDNDSTLTTGAQTLGILPSAQ